MPYYGDISGDFRNLLNEDCEVVVVAVVGGTHHDCYRCPKRAVRNAPQMDEAKWYDMKTVEKRRFMECLGENSPPLEFGYAVFELDDFTNLRSHYKLFQDVSFPPIWDIAIRGIAYTEILYELSGDTNIEFYPDQFRSGVQTDKLCEVIENRLKKAEIECVSSEQVDGVQAADCLAGAVAEEQKGGTPWLEHTNAESQIAECSSWTLIELERLLVS